MIELATIVILGVLLIVTILSLVRIVSGISASTSHSDNGQAGKALDNISNEIRASEERTRKRIERKLPPETLETPNPPEAEEEPILAEFNRRKSAGLGG